MVSVKHGLRRFAYSVTDFRLIPKCKTLVWAKDEVTHYNLQILVSWLTTPLWSCSTVRCLYYVVQREWELLTFLGCIIVMKNRKQGKWNRLLSWKVSVHWKKTSRLALHCLCPPLDSWGKECWSVSARSLWAFFPWYYRSCLLSSQPPSSTQIHHYHL